MTGVDVELPLAGPGSRSYAFIIDWHIRILLAMGWVLAALLGSWAIGGQPATGVIAGLPAAAIYLLYHPVVELAMGGQSPGKRIARVRVVGRDGQPPTVIAILIRNAFRLVDSLPAFYTVGLVSTMVTRDSVRVGDLAAGTVLVNLPDDTRRAAVRQQRLAHQTRLSVADAELVNDLLDRWKQLTPAVRQQLAHTLLGRFGQQPGAASDMDDENLRSALQSLVETPG